MGHSLEPKRGNRREFVSAGLATAALMIGSKGQEVMAQEMTPDQNTAMIRRYIEAVFNGHDLDVLTTYLADDLASHWLGQGDLNGLAAWKEGMVGFFTAFPDATYTLDDLFCVADRGVWRGRWRATHKGVWEGIAPTGHVVNWTVIIIGRFVDGKIAEDWVEYDRLGLYRQLGAIPVVETT
ncbi:MAG: ester cyclase [Thermomicrobiales bacterium]